MKRMTQRQKEYIYSLGFVNGIQFVRKYYGASLKVAHDFVKPMFHPTEHNKPRGLCAL